MKFDEAVNTAREAITVRRVFAEPYTQDGVTVIAAAKVSGGAGGGGGHDREGQEGEGGGFGVQARPAGAFIIKDGTARWMPAVDVNRVIGVLGAVAIACLFTAVRVVKLRAMATHSRG